MIVQEQDVPALQSAEKGSSLSPNPMLEIGDGSVEQLLGDASIIMSGVVPPNAQPPASWQEFPGEEIADGDNEGNFDALVEQVDEQVEEQLQAEMQDDNVIDVPLQHLRDETFDFFYETIGSQERGLTQSKVNFEQIKKTTQVILGFTKDLTDVTVRLGNVTRQSHDLNLAQSKYFSALDVQVAA